MSRRRLGGALLILAGVLSFAAREGWIPGALAPTAAVYVYEKDDGMPPAGVMAGLNRLNRERKITANSADHDVRNNKGAVPSQYAAAFPAAEEAGLPSLVVMGGDKVIRVVKGPKTEAEIVEAVP